MEREEYLKLLVEDFHSAAVATLAADCYPHTRVIDMMLYDENGVYFLTAKGKEFYRELMEQQFIALSAVKEKRSISLRGRVRNIGKDKLDEIFIHNSYMQQLYPGNTRQALEVFLLYKAEGSYFDISDPSHVKRGCFSIGAEEVRESGYFVTERCTGCKSCTTVCPQSCIDTGRVPAVIDQSRCLRCGACFSSCPAKAIELREACSP